MLTFNGPMIAAKPAPADKGATGADDRYEMELIALLGQLEHRREGLVAARLAGRSTQTLTLAEEMLDFVTAFAGRHAPPVAISRDLAEAESNARDFATRLASVRQLYGSSAQEPTAPETTGKTEPIPRQEVARHCFGSLYDAVLAYFMVFTNRFASSRAARGWVEVAAGFVVELKKTAQDPLPA